MKEAELSDIAKCVEAQKTFAKISTAKQYEFMSNDKELAAMLGARTKRIDEVWAADDLAKKSDPKTKSKQEAAERKKQAKLDAERKIGAQESARFYDEYYAMKFHAREEFITNTTKKEITFDFRSIYSLGMKIDRELVDARLTLAVDTFRAINAITLPVTLHFARCVMESRDFYISIGGTHEEWRDTYFMEFKRNCGIELSFDTCQRYFSLCDLFAKYPKLIHGGRGITWFKENITALKNHLDSDTNEAKFWTEPPVGIITFARTEFSIFAAPRAQLDPASSGQAQNTNQQVAQQSVPVQNTNQQTGAPKADLMETTQTGRDLTTGAKLAPTATQTWAQLTTSGKQQARGK